jgi:hypothetical protein
VQPPKIRVTLLLGTCCSYKLLHAFDPSPLLLAAHIAAAAAAKLGAKQLSVEEWWAVEEARSLKPANSKRRAAGLGPVKMKKHKKPTSTSPKAFARKPTSLPSAPSARQKALARQAARNAKDARKNVEGKQYHYIAAPCGRGNRSQMQVPTMTSSHSCEKGNTPIQNKVCARVCALPRSGSLHCMCAYASLYSAVTLEKIKIDDICVVLDQFCEGQVL